MSDRLPIMVAATITRLLVLATCAIESSTKDFLRMFGQSVLDLIWQLAQLRIWHSVHSNSTGSN